MALVVRSASAADAVVLAPMVEALSLHQRDPIGYVSEATVARDLASGTVDAVLAELDGQPAGYSLYHAAYESTYAASGLYIVDLYVADAFRGRGIGRALVAEVARRAKERGLTFVWWTSKTWNSEAHAMYERLGAFTEPVLAHAVFDDAFEALAAEGEVRGSGRS